MNIEKTRIKDLLLIENIVHSDYRGNFSEIFRKDKLEKYLGYNIDFVQSNLVFSKKNTLRGLHFQHEPFAQSKLITVINGVIVDVAVDLRKQSKTYMEYYKIQLNAKKNNSIFIPRGFAHGYLTISKSATILYHVDNLYSPLHEDGIKYDNKKLNIKWDCNHENIIVSNKDDNLNFGQ